MEGYLSRKVQGPGYQGHGLKGVVQVLGVGGGRWIWGKPAWENAREDLKHVVLLSV